MSIDLFSKGKLLSKIARGKIGQRLIPSIDKLGGAIKTTSSGGVGGGLSTATGVIGGILGGFGGFIFGALKKALSFAWSFTAIFSYMIQSAIFLYQFDWNASDEEIDKQLQGQFLGWAAQVGGAIGGALGYFACGIAPTAAMAAINPAAASYIIAKNGDEALEEMQGYLVSIIRASFRISAQTAFFQIYKGVRSILKATPAVRSLFPGIDKWGDKKGARYTLSGVVEKKIESIKNPMQRVFTEAAIEEFFEGCIEGGFAFTQAMDSFVYEQKIKENAQITELLEIKPHRGSDEVVHLVGTREQLKPAITQTMSNYQLLKNRDIGSVIETPPEFFVQHAIKKEDSLNLHIQLVSASNPPYKWTNPDFQKVAICIPDIPLSKIDFEKIRQAIGVNGWVYGKFLARCKLTSGREFHVYASSSSEAKNKAEDLAKLTDAEIDRINVTEMTNSGKRKMHPNQQKNTVRVYPYKISVTRMVQKVGVPRKVRSVKIDIWQPEKPYNFDDKIRSLFL
ncbi:MAG: hypothetical protein ACRC80_08525 [Waterburya sp.]